jgi:hypothetical protein
VSPESDLLPPGKALVIGGQDSGIEALLLDLGGQFLEPAPEGRDVADVVVAMRYGVTRRLAADVARHVFHLHDQPGASMGYGDGASFVVRERDAVRLLHRLRALDAAPDVVVARSTDLLPAQLRGLTQALPPGTRLEMAG